MPDRIRVLFRIFRVRYLTDDQISPDVLRNRGQIKNSMQTAAALVLGFLIAIGGTHRWIGQSLEVAMGFNGAAALLGEVLMIFAVVMGCGIIADHPKLLVFGAWGCAVWAWLMFVFSLFKLAHNPDTVDNIAWLLWLYLGLDYLINAQSHLASQ